MSPECPPVSEPEDNLQAYVPGHAWVLSFEGPERITVCYHCGADQRTSPQACFANEEWTVIE